MAVTLSASQMRDCVQIPIVNDDIFDPNEVFSVVLTTTTAGAVIRSDLSSADVTIGDDDLQRK